MVAYVSVTHHHAKCSTSCWNSITLENLLSHNPTIIYHLLLNFYCKLLVYCLPLDVILSSFETNIQAARVFRIWCVHTVI